MESNKNRQIGNILATPQTSISFSFRPDFLKNRKICTVRSFGAAVTVSRYEDRPRARAEAREVK